MLIRRSTPTTPTQVRSIVVAGRQLRVAVRHGDGTRVPLLLFNGIGASLDLLQPFVDALDPSLEVISFDVPGVGGSPLPARPYRFTGLCRLASQMLDTLGYRSPVDVLGISWGGGVAQHFALTARRRCRRLVLVSTATGAIMVPARPAVLVRMITPRRYLDPEHLQRVAPTLYGGTARDDPEWVKTMMHAQSRVGSPRGYLYQLAGRDRLDEPSVPAAAAPAHADPVRRRRPADPAGQRPAAAAAHPALAAARLPRRAPEPGHRGRRARAGRGRLPDRGRPGRHPRSPARAQEGPMTSAPDSDFYSLELLLDPAGRQKLQQVREFMEKEIEPVINRYWTREEFPRELIPAIGRLGIVGLAYDGYGCAGGGNLLDGMVAMELARVDSSIATFFGVHSGLAMGSIYLCGSEEQKQRWLPAMARLEKIGAFGLTEPEVGSGASRGLTTTARRDGDEWVLNGQKKWIGNATFADYVVIWARDLEDNQVKGFVVEQPTPGFSTTKMRDKIALRVVQNAYITMEDARVPEANRLQNANSFRDTAAVLRLTRAGVAWMAVGCGRGAYEHALAYAKERQQFGRPIAGFQLVQDQLVRMLANVTSSACLCVRLAQLQEAGIADDQHSALAKAFCTVRMRETVGLARELLGGNGILLEYHVGRFVADAEAIYSYEGTREMNTLIVGRAITGTGAFV